MHPPSAEDSTTSIAAKDMTMTTFMVEMLQRLMGLFFVGTRTCNSDQSLQRSDELMRITEPRKIQDSTEGESGTNSISG